MNLKETRLKETQKTLAGFIQFEESKFCNYYKHPELKIIMVEYKQDALIDLNEAKEIIKIVKSASLGMEKIFGITALSKGASADAEARAYFANDKFSQEDTAAMALIIKQLAQRLLFRLYLKFNKPKSPIKAFNQIDEAVSWLKSQGA